MALFGSRKKCQSAKGRQKRNQEAGLVFTALICGCVYNLHIVVQIEFSCINHTSA
jgi:hypothetical protein